MRASDVRRGLTLIELLVSLAVLSIILAAVMSVVVTITRQRRESSNQVDTRVNGRIALSLMAFDAANAGYRFGTPPLAVRVLQNVTGTEPELADATAAPAPWTGGCGGLAGWTPVPGTDVIEFRQGAAGPLPGRAVNNGSAFTGAANPFTTAGATASANVIVLMSNGVTGCAGRLQAGGINSGAVTLLKADLRTNAAPSNYPTAGPGLCPAAQMAVTALGQATRYLVCRPPAIGPPNLRPALFRQRYDGTMAMTAFDRVQDGIEDLQVASVLANQVNGATMVGGPTCVGTGAAARCTCGLTVGGDCAGYDPDPTSGGGALNGASAAAAERSAMLLRAVRVAVTTISPRPRGFGSEFAGIARPASFNHPAGTVGQIADQVVVGAENNQRAVVEATFLPQNIVMVTP
ncbi:MAG: prepilin-type N-terminal cleavage/methylation domain-containing protein [Myxococcaceae bacterium]|nr:prepilin-type N-terminal cleavage/methylation domain-containing protein [Myxococcaceae bacterium]